MDSGVTLFRDLGVPVALLIGMGYGFYHGMVWLGNQVIVPLHKRHLQFLDKVEAAVESLTSSQQRLGNELERMSETMRCHYGATENRKHG
jgi:hypothetical protein